MRQLEVDAAIAALTGTQEEFMQDEQDKRFHRTIRIAILAALVFMLVFICGGMLNAYRNSFKPACAQGQALYYVPNADGKTTCIVVNLQTEVQP